MEIKLTDATKMNLTKPYGIIYTMRTGRIKDIAVTTATLNKTCITNTRIGKPTCLFIKYKRTKTR